MTADVRALLAELGVTPVLHGGGTKTTIGGGPVRPGVAEMMAAALEHYVVLEELEAAAARWIAAAAGVEAAVITGGAASAMVLAAGAALTAADPRAPRRMPHTTELAATELVVQASHWGRYTYVYGLAGATCKLAGTVNECPLDAINAVVGPKTAALTHLEGPGIAQVGPPLVEICDYAHARGLPVIVDAAAMLPPRSNLHRYTDLGADLVIFSGGKVIGGPQGTGLLLGRADLVATARMLSAPRQGLGRPHKVGKEQILGLVVALRAFLATPEEQERALLDARARELAAGLSAVPGWSARVVCDAHEFMTPTVLLSPDATRDLAAMQSALLAGSPRVFVQTSHDGRSLTVSPLSLPVDAVSQAVTTVAAALRAAAGSLA